MHFVPTFESLDVELRVLPCVASLHISSDRFRGNQVSTIPDLKLCQSMRNKVEFPLVRFRFIPSIKEYKVDWVDTFEVNVYLGVFSNRRRCTSSIHTNGRKVKGIEMDEYSLLSNNLFKRTMDFLFKEQHVPIDFKVVYCVVSGHSFRKGCSGCTFFLPECV